MGHLSFETRDSRSLSNINASLNERDVICQLPPYSFRFPQEQYTTGSNMHVYLKNLCMKLYKVDFLIIHPKNLRYYTNILIYTEIILEFKLIFKKLLFLEKEKM